VSVITNCLSMGEAVGHAVCGIAAGIDRKGTLQSVVGGSVQQIADRNHPGHPAREEDQLASRPTFAKRLCHGVLFSSSIAEVVVSDAKVHCFQHCVAGKKRLVGCVPKIMFRRSLAQILGPASATNKEH